MAPETKSSNANPSNNKKRKNRYLPQNKPVKKGSYPLRPGVQGFFITCDGGRERQAAHEAIDVIDSFYEELVQGDDSGGCLAVQPSKPVNKKTIFTYSDSSSSDDDDEEEEEEESKESENKKEEGEKQSDSHRDDNANCGGPENENFDPSEKNNVSCEIQREGKKDDKADEKEDNGKADDIERSIDGAMEPFPKKQCLESATAKSANISRGKAEEQSIDKLIEAEIQQLGNKNKRRFISLDSGCNGVCFVQMRRRDGDPSVKDIVQHMMTSAALKRKHISRFILRVLPIEVACYASEADITVSIKPLIEGYFPVETQNPLKFAVLYDARANTGIERMKIINAVAKSVPAPHKVDLNNPDKNIVVQIVKTVCLIGVIEKYKVLGKYNLRQLTSPQE